MGSMVSLIPLLRFTRQYDFNKQAMKKSTLLFCFCILLLVVCIVCFFLINRKEDKLSSTTKTHDVFYTKDCGYDCKKIPLIKPYFLGNTTKIEDIWYLTDATNSGLPVSSLNILDSVIISFYFDKYIIASKRDTIWYIHLPSQNKYLKFSSEHKFSPKKFIKLRIRK